MHFLVGFLLFTLAFAGPALAGGVVLMVNMNYSSEELKAAMETAAARGQRVEMVPPREMIKLAEPMFHKRDGLEEELEQKFPPKKSSLPNPAKRQEQNELFAEEQSLRLRSALYGIIRKGSAWNDDPEIANYVSSARKNELFEMYQKVFQQEQKNGDMFEQLRRKAAELKAKGDRVDSLLLSSHSDGSNLTGETSNRLSANELYQLKKEQPALFDSPRHVWLLGCYDMTRPHHQAWRNDLFPNASMIAGFGVKAPSRFDEKSSNYIRQTSAIADRLDREMAAKGKPLDPAYVGNLFKSLSTFTTEAHPGVVDYCYSVVEGQPGAWSHNCEDQWRELYATKDKMEDYISVLAPREDPPSAGGGVLRAFYNTLQLACPAQEAKSERDHWQQSERLRVTTRENVIRLIFWWNVQHNFSAYFDTDILAMNARLSKAGIDPMPQIDGSLSRVEFVNTYYAIRKRLKDNLSLRKDFESLYDPLLLLKGEDSVAAGEKISVPETLKRNAIPFNWIEGTTVMRKR